MKYILISVVVLLSLSCNNNGPEKFTVSGTFTGVAGKKIMLAELPFNNPQRLVVDSATLDSTGKFTLSTIQQQEGMYQLFIADGPGILLINDTSDIVVHANIDSLGKYKIEHSKASQSIKSLYDRLSVLQQTAARTNLVADSITKAKTPDSLQAPYLKARDRSNKTIIDFLNSYLSLEKNGTALWYGLGVASRFYTKEQWSAALQKALVNHSHHPGLAMMKVSVAAAAEQEAIGKELINKPVADIALPDTSGKPVSVSSFKGKWLLIDFWASWCAPCRAESPNLVAAYKQYRYKNFTILGISLDKDKAAWTKAIAKDSLIWTQVSDLKEWDSKAAQLYDFNQIPFNILVDTAGTAIAVNLHGAALQEKLKELLVKQ
jgi:peroxiredoxin